MVEITKLDSSGQITIIPKPELRPFWVDSRTKFAQILARLHPSASLQTELLTHAWPVCDLFPERKARQLKDLGSIWEFHGQYFCFLRYLAFIN